MNNDLIKRRDAALVEARILLERSADVLSAPDEERYNELLAEVDALNDRIRRFRQLDDSTQVEHGDGATAPERFNVIRSTDIYETRSIERAGGTATLEGGKLLVDRAARAIDTWAKDYDSPPEHQESAAKLVRSPRSRRDREIADYMVRAGHPDYYEAFLEYLAGGPPNISSDRMPVVRAVHDAAMLQRAAMAEGSTTAGGFMVPVVIDPTIILTNVGTANPFRQIATTKVITTQSWKGITSAGVTAEWTAEASEVADASPPVAQPTITPVRADAYVQASMELLQDTDIAQQIVGVFADAKDRHEGTAFAVGTGSTQPTGIVTALQNTTASRVATTTNGAYGAVDVFALDNSLPQRYRQNASWVANKSIFNLTRQFATGVANQFSFWTDFGAGRSSTLIGYPTYESSAMFNAPLSTATASNDDILVLGDFRQGFYVIDRMGMEVLYNPMVIGANRRPTAEVAWLMLWRTTSNVVNADAFRMARA